MLPLYAERFHASPIAIGWLTGIYSGMQIIFTPILGRLSDRFGRRPVLMLSLAGTALGFVLMGMAHSLLLLFVARIIAGITGGNISIPQAYIADVTTPETRSKWMGMIGAAFGLGFTFGPMIGGIMSRISYSAPFYFAAGARGGERRSALLHPAGKPAEGTSRATARRRLHRRRSFVTAAAGCSALWSRPISSSSPVSPIMTTLFALFTEKRFGYDAHANGYLFGFIGIMTVIVQGGLIGRLVKMFGETALARVGLLITAASLALMPWCGNLTWLLVVCVGLSLGSGFASPPLNGLASQMIDRSWQGRALGVMQSAGSTARLLGPLLGGSLLMLDLHKPLSHYGETSILRRGFPLPDRSRARILFEKTGRRSRCQKRFQ